MDSDRRRFLVLAGSGMALWALGRAGAAETPAAAPAGDAVHLTLNVEGMH